MEQGQDVRHWVSGSAVASFVVQQLISTAGAMLLGTVTVLIAASLLAFFTRSSAGGSLVDKVVDQPIFEVGADNPYFVGPILMGFLLGWMSRRSSESRAAAWVWVLPTLALAWNVMTWKSYSPLPRWADVQANFFTANCGDSECINELLLTAPFYTSVAYSLGWVGGKVSFLGCRRPQGHDSSQEL